MQWFPFLTLSLKWNCPKEREWLCVHIYKLSRGSGLILRLTWMFTVSTRLLRVWAWLCNLYTVNCSINQGSVGWVATCFSLLGWMCDFFTSKLAALFCGVLSLPWTAGAIDLILDTTSFAGHPALLLLELNSWLSFLTCFFDFKHKPQ